MLDGPVGGHRRFDLRGGDVLALPAEGVAERSTNAA